MWFNTVVFSSKFNPPIIDSLFRDITKKSIGIFFLKFPKNPKSNLTKFDQFKCCSIKWYLLTHSIQLIELCCCCRTGFTERETNSSRATHAFQILIDIEIFPMLSDTTIRNENNRQR